jgi:hypothetical protein
MEKEQLEISEGNMKRRELPGSGVLTYRSDGEVVLPMITCKYERQETCG